MDKETTSSGRTASTRDWGNPVDGDIERVTVRDPETGKVGIAEGRPSDHDKTVERADERANG